MLIGARTAAWGGSGGDFSNTYIHFDGNSWINFGVGPFVNYGSYIVEITADAGVGYKESSFNYNYFYDGAFGNIGASPNSAMSNAIIKNGRWEPGFKLNGNSSGNIYRTPCTTISNPAIATETGATRGLFSIGIEEYNSRFRCFTSYNGTKQEYGPEFDTIGGKWEFQWSVAYAYPRIGWAYLGSTSYGAGNPSVFDIYSLKFTQGGVATHTLIPARATDGQGCLYDEVGGLFWKNSGTGTITLNGTPKYMES